MTITCQIYMGFGGSGAKTLEQLAQMFADDQEWAHRSETEAYFLLADTDLDDLRKYEENIRRCLTRVGAQVFVRSIGLSHGVQDMSDLIHEQLKPGMSDAQSLARLEACWWFDRDKRPFIARNIQLSPTEGASQCPAVSYFLAWNAICGTNSRVKTVIDELVYEMNGRVSSRHGTDNYEVNLYTVAGLAGGTGRGSWSTLSFKIIQEFVARGKKARAIGQFFDQSCFASVGAGTQGQQTKLIINSLTGISEITGWIQNDRHLADARYVHGQPSFHGAARPEMDVIDAQRLVKSDQHQGCSPVQQAWIVFAEGPTRKLEGGEHYTLAAAALYGRTAKSEIGSQLSNSYQLMGSVGASLYRVDVHGIRAYLRDSLELRAAQEFAAKPAGAQVEETADAILSPLLAAREDENRDAPAADAKPANGHFGARINQKLWNRKKRRVMELLGDGAAEKGTINALDKEGRDDAIAKLANFHADRGELEKDLLEVVRNAIQHVHPTCSYLEGLSDEQRMQLGGPDLIARYMRACLLRPMNKPEDAAKTLDAHYKSLVVARETMKELTARLGSISAALRPQDGKPTDSKSEVKAAVAEADKLSGKFLGAMNVLADRFTNEERDLLKNSLKRMVLKCGRAEAASILEQWIEPLKTRLKQWGDNLGEASKRAERHAESLQKKLDAERRDDLFTVENDFARAERGQFSRSSRPVETVLQPALSINNKDRLAGWLESLHDQKDQRFVDGLADIRRYSLESAFIMEREMSLTEEAIKTIRRELGARWKTLGAKIVIPESFLQSHFRLGQVAEELVTEWASRMDAATTHPDKLQNLRREFERLFGFQLRTSDGKHLPESRKEIVKNMAMRLGQTCRAQYVSSAVGSSPSTLVFLPTDKSLIPSKTDLKQTILELDGQAKASVKFHADLERDEAEREVEGDARGNPFMMLAVAIETFRSNSDQADRQLVESKELDLESVTSLGYWRDSANTHVTTFLEWVEDPDGKSMFADVSFSFGLGYIMPAFVRDERLRSGRWRPWARNTEGAVQKAKERMANRTTDAIVYALLQPQGERLSQLAVTDLAGTKQPWTLPLLAFGPHQSTKNAFTFTRQSFKPVGDGWAPKGPEFKAGASCSSLKKLYEYLESNPEVVTAIFREAHHYFGTVCRAEGVVERDVKAMFDASSTRIRNEIQDALSGLANYADYEPLLEQILARADAFVGLERAELAEIYKD